MAAAMGFARDAEQLGRLIDAARARMPAADDGAGRGGGPTDAAAGGGATAVALPPVGPAHRRCGGVGDGGMHNRMGGGGGGGVGDGGMHNRMGAAGRGGGSVVATARRPAAPPTRRPAVPSGRSARATAA